MSAKLSCNGECEQCSTWDICAEQSAPVEKLIQPCPICIGRGWNPLSVDHVRNGAMIRVDIKEYCDTCGGSGTIPSLA